MLGVSSRTLKKHGAVSRECAAEMAKGALKRSQARIVVSITGIAGPGRAESGKPAGLVFFAAVSRTGKKIARNSMFRGVGRSLVRRKSVLQALAMMQQLANKERSAD
jgi:nicotinamide-nucleotide amidase